MCAPLAAIAGVVSAVGTGVSALQASAAKRYQAKIDERNAAAESEAAADAIEQGRREATNLYRRTGQIEGRQLAAAAARGIDTSFGSPLDVQRDTAALGAEEVGVLHQQTGRSVRGFDLNAANHRAKARAARMAATEALVGGAFDMGVGILNTIPKFEK